MPREPKPWWRRDRGAWFVTINGTRYNLGPDRETAFRRFHELMAQPQKRTVPSNSVPALIDAFLEWTKQHRASDTYEWYRSRCQLFCIRYPDLKVTELKPFHVQQWYDSFTHLSGGSKRNYCRAIQRAMRWAEEQGHIDRSPIAHMRKPKGGKREQVISEEEWQSILACVPDREFHDLLILTWQTGCRPQESLKVEARHVDLTNSRWVIPSGEAKTDFPRVVYLTDDALQITRRLMLKHPQGPLFRNTKGRPWTTDAVNCRFCRIQEKLGVKYCLYVIRHTWMNRLLKSGVDALTVAILAGHCDPSTVAKVYQHLSLDPKHLLEQAKRAS